MMSSLVGMEEGEDTQGHRLTTPDITFQKSKSAPIHRWFPYVEGFSGRFVRRVLTDLNLPDGAVVLDPFGGCGTTSVESTLLGMDSISLDVNPFMCFTIRIDSDIHGLWISDIIRIQCDAHSI